MFLVVSLLNYMQDKLHIAAIRLYLPAYNVILGLSSLKKNTKEDTWTCNALSRNHYWRMIRIKSTCIGV